MTIYTYHNYLAKTLVSWNDYVKQTTDTVQGRYVQYDNVYNLPRGLKTSKVCGIMLNKNSSDRLPNGLFELEGIEELIIIKCGNDYCYNKIDERISKSDLIRLKELKLQSLSLIGCGLEDIDFVNELTTLTSLNLTSNKLTSINITLPNLKYLTVDNNQISTYSVPDSLTSFKISFNALTTFQPLPKLERLDISGNMRLSQEEIDKFKLSTESIKVKLDKCDYSYQEHIYLSKKYFDYKNENTGIYRCNYSFCSIIETDEEDYSEDYDSDESD